MEDIIKNNGLHVKEFYRGQGRTQETLRIMELILAMAKEISERPATSNTNLGIDLEALQRNVAVKTLAELGQRITESK